MDGRWIGRGLAVGFVSALLLATAPGCGDDDGPAAKRDIKKAPIPLDGKAASNGATGVLSNKTFAVPNNVLATNATPKELADLLRSSSGTKITFLEMNGANGKFKMENPTLSGTVKIASCTFDVLEPSQYAGGRIFIANCQLNVTASGVSTEAPVSGTATISFNGSDSAPVTVTVSQSPSGELIIDGKATQVKPPQLTGSRTG